MLGWAKWLGVDGMACDVFGSMVVKCIKQMTVGIDVESRVAPRS